eukprot:PLAT2932.1.p1 GENE.PLAT2932.1~~PLAT2932.1.p1  ORF type:complete len:256 (-),score=112.81 PLAT2932.1:212-916(-)
MAAAEIPTTITLYGNPICPFAQRAWLAAKEKELDIDFTNIPLGPAKPESYLEINPRGTVPAVKLHDEEEHIIIESMICVEFFEDQWPERGTSLRPKDPLKLVTMRLFLDEVSSAIGPMYGLLKRGGSDEKATLVETVAQKLAAVEARMVSTSDGPLLFGDELCIGDIALFPFLDRFRHTISHYWDVQVLDDLPRLQAFVAAMDERDSVKETSQTADYYIKGYVSYAHPKKAADE